VFKEFIERVVTTVANFKIISSDIPEYSFYKRTDNDRVRFLVVLSVETLGSPEEYNDAILGCAPEEMKSSSAFEKNTDVVILLNINASTSKAFKTHEKKIFSIEENPYSFKKHVLYTSDAESSLIEKRFINSDTLSSDLVRLLENREEFSKYKNEPYKASIYGLVAKIYIKLPFLKIESSSQSEIRDLDSMVDQALKEDSNLKFTTSMLELNEGELELSIEKYLYE